MKQEEAKVLEEFLNEVRDADEPTLANTLKALGYMKDLVDMLWDAVPWGKAFNLNVQLLNLAPMAARTVLTADMRARAGRRPALGAEKGGG